MDADARIWGLASILLLRRVGGRHAGGGSPRLSHEEGADETSMTNRRAVNAVAAAAILTAWCGLYAFLHPRPPGPDPGPHKALGRALAAEATRSLAPGARILVIARDAEPYRVPAAAIQVESFLRALKKTGQPVAGVHRIRLDPLRLTAVPPGDFFDLLRHGTDRDVIVSFLGPPVLERDQWARLGPRHPRVLAVCTGAMPAQVDLRSLFQQGLLSAAVIDKGAVVSPSTSDRGGGEFDRHFQWVTPATLDALPGSPTASGGSSHE